MADLMRISLFPLPSSVFYPTTLLPLHIFEPRYRQMITDSIDSEQWIGMTLLQPGYEPDYYGKPAINPIGCAGSLHKWHKHDDGKFDIVLLGQSRFRIVQETGDALYREAEVELLTNTNDQPLTRDENSTQHKLMKLYFEYREALPEPHRSHMELDIQSCQSLGDVTDRMAHRFDMELQEQQAFLEELDVTQRVARLEEIIALKTRIIKQSSIFSRKGIDARWN